MNVRKILVHFKWKIEVVMQLTETNISCTGMYDGIWNSFGEKQEMRYINKCVIDIHNQCSNVPLIVCIKWLAYLLVDSKYFTNICRNDKLLPWGLQSQLVSHRQKVPSLGYYYWKGGGWFCINISKIHDTFSEILQQVRGSLPVLNSGGGISPPENLCFRWLKNAIFPTNSIMPYRKKNGNSTLISSQCLIIFIQSRINTVIDLF